MDQRIGNFHQACKDVYISPKRTQDAMMKNYGVSGSMRQLMLSSFSALVVEHMEKFIGNVCRNTVDFFESSSMHCLQRLRRNPIPKASFEKGESRESVLLLLLFHSAICILLQPILPY